jgi:hypothetical protein
MTIGLLSAIAKLGINSSHYDCSSPLNCFGMVDVAMMSAFELYHLKIFDDRSLLP